MPKLSSVTLNQKRSGIRDIMDLTINMENVLHLEVGEPLFATPEHIVEAAYKAVKSGYTKYMPNAGDVALRKAIVERLKNDYNLDLGVDNTVVSVGAVGALNSAVRVIVEPGDEVLIPDPGWPNYEMIVNYSGAVAKRYKLDPGNGYLPSLSDIEKQITSKTKGIIINSPSNPIGVVFPGETMADLVSLAKDKDIFLISDEVYEKIIFENDHTCAVNYDDEGRVITVFSFSKTYSMTGWRVGYAVAEESVAKEIAKYQEASVSCAPSLSQKAAEAALNGSQECVTKMRETYKENLNLARKILDENRVNYFTPQGAFYMWIDAGCDNSEEFAKNLLLNHRVALAPGTTFGKEHKNYVRVSLASPKNVINEGLNILANIINKDASNI